MPATDFIRYPEAAARYATSERTLRQRIREGKLNRYRMRGNRRIILLSVAELDDLFSAEPMPA